MDENKFKKLMQNTGLDDPGLSFTDDVMKMIESQEELSLNPALLSVLKNELLTEPSFDFQDKIMAKIQLKGNKVLEPIITKKAGLIILGLVILILFFVMIYSHSDSSHLQNGSYFSGFSLNLPGTTAGMIRIASSMLPYLFPLSILLFLDYFFRTRPARLSSGE